ncbi:MAG: cation:dicarboxylase symporter family transporter, partial [Bacteroidota bacterium]
MANFKLKLHHKILLALILGAIFGAIFNVSKYKLEITTRVDKAETKSEVVERWQKIEFVDGETKALKATFGADDQLKILPYFGKLSAADKSKTMVNVTLASGEQKSFANLKMIDKVKTIAVIIKPVGTIFIRLLMFVAIPLVLASLLVGAASLGDIRKVGRIGAKTLGFYLITIVSAISLGLLFVNTIQPGTRLASEAREKLMVSFQHNVQEKIQQETSVDLIDMLVKIVPTNPIDALAKGYMLAVIFFALMLGVALTLLPKNRSAP